MVICLLLGRQRHESGDVQLGERCVAKGHGRIAQRMHLLHLHIILCSYCRILCFYCRNPVFLLLHPVFLLLHPVFLLLHPVFLLLHPVLLPLHPVFLLLHPVFLLVQGQWRAESG